MKHKTGCVAVVAALAMMSVSILSVPAHATASPRRVSGAAAFHGETPVQSPNAPATRSAETTSAPTIGSNVQLNQDEATHPSSPHNEVAVAVNPANANNIVAGANDYRNGAGGESGYYVSMNGGTSWSDGAFVSGGVMPAGVDSAGDASLAFKSDGTRLYYSQIAFSTTAPALDGCDASSGAYVATSTNGGSTWANGSAKAVALNSATVFNDKPWVTVDAGGTVLVSYSKFVFSLPSDCVSKLTGDSPIKLKRSTDGGTTFGPEIDVSGSYIASQGSVPVVAPGGTVFVAFEGGGPSCSDCIVVAKSTDGGASFNSQQELADIQGLLEIKADNSGGTVRADSFPSMAAAPNGNLYVVWAEVRGGNPDADIWMSSSMNNGTSWSSPSRVNQVTPSDQFFPSVAIDSDGTVWVSYSDRRNDPDNVLYRQYVSHSHDAGGTWTDTAVANVSSDPGAVAFSSGEFFIGDYNGIAAIPGGGAFTTWCDTRNTSGPNGQEDAFGAHISTTGAPALTAGGAPSIAVTGTTFTLSGNLSSDGVGRGGKIISLQRRAIGSSSWSAISFPTTSSNGNYSGSLGKPGATADYRAVFSGDAQVLPATSPVVRLYVRVGIIFNAASISLPRGGTARFSGTVVPNHAGRKVQLQVLSGSTWSTIQTITLDGNSNYKASARITTAGNRLYRLIFATQDGDHAWNISRYIMIHWA